MGQHVHTKLSTERNLSQTQTLPPLNIQNHIATDLGSIAIAAVSPSLFCHGQENGQISTCPRFVTHLSPLHASTFCPTSSSSPTLNSYLSGSYTPVPFATAVGEDSAARLWQSFSQTGDIHGFDQQQGLGLGIGHESPSREESKTSGTMYGAAVCLRQSVPAGSSRKFIFSIAWDRPLVRFGSGRAFRRYYTRFFGSS